MSFGSSFTDLAMLGITPASIDRAIGENILIQAEVIRVTNKTLETWKEIWDESDHPYETGAYKDSIVASYETKASGYFSGLVKTMDSKAHWLEYGTVKMAEFAPAQKTVDRMNGELSGHTSKKSGGGFVGHVGA